MAEGTRNTGRGRKKPVEMLPDMGRLQPQARELEEAVGCVDAGERRVLDRQRDLEAGVFL